MLRDRNREENRKRRNLTQVIEDQRKSDFISYNVIFL